MANEQDYVDLGLSSADICRALERGMDGKSLNDLSKSVQDAINQLTTWVNVLIHVSCPSTYHRLDLRTVAEIREEVLKRSERSGVSRFLHSRDDKDMITAWKSDLNRLLQVFNVCPVCLRLGVTDFPSQDRTYFEHPCHRCRHSSRHVEYRGPEPSGE